MAGFRLGRSVRRGVANVASRFGGQEEVVKFNDLIDRGLLTVGRHTYGRPQVAMYRGSESQVTIGSFCSISPGVQIVIGGIHPARWVSTYPFRAMWSLPGAFADGMPATNGPVDIGCDVWIGTDAMILSGVTVGDGAIIAARSVVTRDVRPYSIVAGLPAREIGMRFADEQVAELLRVTWWEWPDEQIRAAVPLLSSDDIAGFLQAYRPPAPD